MNLILQAIKALLRKVENGLSQTASALSEQIEKINTDIEEVKTTADEAKTTADEAKTTATIRITAVPHVSGTSYIADVSAAVAKNHLKSGRFVYMLIDGENYYPINGGATNQLSFIGFTLSTNDSGVGYKCVRLSGKNVYASANGNL
ncbi:MAG: hypothetical protein IJY28_01595 [Clostridia bacterium]|nr:hypothetical protein [Clostridia bacterium]